MISNLIMECKIAVDIMLADTKDIDGKAYGHMILQLPEDKLQGEPGDLFICARKIL